MIFCVAGGNRIRHKRVHEVRGTSRRGLSVVEAVRALRLGEARARQSASRRAAINRAARACLGRQAQARSHQHGKKGVRTLECTAWGNPSGASAMPLEKHFPQPGVKVWAAWKRGRNGNRRGAILTRPIFRGGGKHPDLLKERSLRGRRLERGSWLVRFCS